MSKPRHLDSVRGQSLTVLLFFMAIAITVTTAAIMITLVNAQAGSRFQQGTSVYYAAESGAENALMRLLRDPTYTGEVLNATQMGITGISVEVCVVTVSPTLKTVYSSARLGTYTRTVKLTVTDNVGVLKVVSWVEQSQFYYCITASPTPTP